MEKKNLGNYIFSDKYEPCCVCGKPTRRIEINYEAYICSLKCENILEEQVKRDVEA